MSEQSERNPIATKRVVYELAGMDGVLVDRDIEYHHAGEGGQTLDVYYPPGERKALPAVVLVSGYSDEGFRRIVGCRFKELGSCISWAQLMAMSGIAAITYTNRDPAADVHVLLDYIRQNSGSMNVDANRIGLFASSGHVPLALSLLMDGAASKPRCAILCYGYTMDVDGSTDVADAAKQWRFANPCAGRSADELVRDVPLFIARAGADEMPHLNHSMDRFLAKALARNLPVTIVNEPGAPHAFDLLHDTDATREIVRRILAFAQFTLAGAVD
jgi:hypothetical protein